jgi:serine/threonine-protein kinase RsbW
MAMRRVSRGQVRGILSGTEGTPHSGATTSARGAAHVSQLTSVVLTFPAQPSFLRLARLCSADAGSRADFSTEEIDDLRIGVDELCHHLLTGSGLVTITLTTAPTYIEVSGQSTRPGGPSLSQLSRTIVAAVVDEHDLGDEEHGAWFRLVKRRAVSSTSLA